MNPFDMGERGVAGFFRYARERYQVMLYRRLSVDPPWTSDPVLQRYRFCNVHREHDRVTQWMHEQVRSRREYREKLVQAIGIARWFNRPETVALLQRGSSPDLLISWSAAEARRRLRQMHSGPVVTGAYMIKTPGGLDKVEGMVQCITDLVRGAASWPSADAIQRELEERRCTLEETHEMLCRVPYIGGFMAYEIVSDLRWTWLLERAPDILTWAHAGPGALRGASWILDEGPELLDPHRGSSQRVALSLMRELLAASQDPRYWPQKEWQPWEMREVEHTLCEYAKYRKGLTGASLKRRYP